MSKLRVAAVLVCVLLTVGGCGKSGGHETARIKGKVTLDGKALTEGGTVVFEPEHQGKMATGTVQADGSFELTTYKAGDGAIVGKHRVAITPVVKLVPDTAPDTESEQKSSIPYKYRATSSSGIVFEVKSGETNDCPLELDSKKK